MNKEYGIYIAAGALLVIVVAGVLLVKRDAATPVSILGTVATSTEPASTSTPPTPDSPAKPASQKPSTPAPTAPTAAPFALVAGEAVASWDFTGTHNDNGQLEARVRAEIEKMKGLLNNSEMFSNYELYVSIANQYELLGEGKQEYTYLNYALAIDSTKTGLAWHNMGKLLERLGAYKSARVAYDRMIQAQTTSQYVRARLEFLKAHMPEDTDAIKQAELDLAASQG